MIPLKLQLKNFLSYGAQFHAIDFSTHQLICLSGKNGHGKSALLDAITWAIWGQARKIAGTAKPDAQLLRLGQTHMAVIFDFFFNNSTYRIRREYSQTYQKPYAALDFAIIDKETNKIIPLTDKTIRDTQLKIEETLGLDFESFINSAFLRQGQANEFSKKSPKERKDILANILNLARFEKIRRLANEKIKQSTTELQLAQQMAHRMTQELENNAAHAEQLQRLNSTFSTIDSNISRQQAIMIKNQEEQKDFALKLQLKAKVEFQQDQLQATMKQLKATIIEQFNTWRHVNRQLRQLPDLQKLETEKSEILVRIANHQQQLHEQLQLKERLIELKESHQQLVKQLTDKQTILHMHKRTEYERLLMEEQLLLQSQQQLMQQNAATKIELENIDAQLKKITIVSDDSQLQLAEKFFIKRKSYYQIWLSRLQSLQKELLELDSKKMLVQESNNPCCPLCEQNLSSSRKRFLKVKFIKLKHSYQHKINRLSAILKRLKPLLISQHDELKALQQKNEHEKRQVLAHEELAKQRNKLQVLFAQQISAITQIKNNSVEKQKNKLAVEQEVKLLIDSFGIELANNETIRESAQQIALLEKQIPSDAIDYRKQSQLNNRISEIDSIKSHYHALLKDKEKQIERYGMVQQIARQIRTLKTEQEQITKQLVTLNELQQQKNMLEIEEKNLSSTLASLQNQKQQIMHEKGKLEQLCKQQEETKVAIQEAMMKIKQLTDTITDYQAVSTAVGKEGIQALIIEEALPEIEQEANYLLAQLSNNESHIIIDSLRDLKKGGTKETLDIKISDAMGIRPYELFSGGEAFRIDFSLRIAISKLLARRAGTSLQTLIIDEGFGSQDEEGISHLMDAIHRIQAHFAKVIIVSHLPILKDQFPVHFLVEKGPNGSAVRVVEQG
jgi:exonuclease SbcC